jgi:hypothetical protein
MKDREPRTENRERAAIHVILSFRFSVLHFPGHRLIGLRRFWSLLWLGILTLPAVAQDAGKPFGQGTHALRGIIRSPKPIPGYERRFELTPIKELQQFDPANTLVIVLGDPNPLLKLQQHTAGLRNFIQRGGAFLLASDQPVRQPLFFELGAEVTGDYYQAAGSWARGGC